VFWWDPLDANSLKMNVDAGCFEEGETSYGMLIRNRRGQVLLAATKVEEIHISPTLA
jgi:hypothetical protein